MKVSLLKLHRRKEQPRQGGPKSNYRIGVFSVCFLISFALWFMNMLSKKYTESLVFFIQYEHLSQAVNHEGTTDTMRLKVNASGYRVLGYKLGIFDKLLKVDASQFRHKGNQYFYTLTNHIHSEKIEEQLGDEVKMLDISPDTLFIAPAIPQTPGS
jgi:hypothetical protein